MPQTVCSATRETIVISSQHTAITEQPLLATPRESPRAAMKIRESQKKKNSGRGTLALEHQLPSGERKRPGLKQRINPETKICILDFDLGIKLENETPKPILSDKDKHILVYQEQCPWHRPFNARYKEYTRNSLHQEAKQYMSRTFPCLRWIDKHTTEGKTLKLHFEADQALFPQ